MTIALLLFTACATTPNAPAPNPPTVAGTTTEAMAPWNANPAIAAPPVVLTEWSKAENRATCAPMTFAAFGERASGGTPRRANFSGGWGVAWDVPGLPGRDATGRSCATCGRGVFGISGAGITVGEDEDAVGFPYRVDYAGKNWAGWALEGETGPNWLGQVRVDDQQCIYYVWSFLGREHVEELVRNVRRVRQ
ncbi:MAG TPA: hypothetical protein VE010_15180 [Thermoanaerobaculia bacterium]|nr:hypothetical protein [Thermoanaerobaculia bacterium]